MTRPSSEYDMVQLEHLAAYCLSFALEVKEERQILEALYVYHP